MECCLAPGELVRLDGTEEGVVLRCSSGILWLTCGDGRDYLLSSGMSFSVTAGQTAVAEALYSAECTLGVPATAGKPVLRPVIRLAAC